MRLITKLKYQKIINESNDSSNLQAKTPSKKDIQSPKVHNDPSPAPYQPKAPFPQCLIEPSPFGKKDATMEEMLEIFKQVKISLPLLEAVKQIPSYAKLIQSSNIRLSQSSKTQELQLFHVQLVTTPLKGLYLT